MTCSALHKNSGYRVRDSMKSIDDFGGGGLFFEQNAKQVCNAVRKVMQPYVLHCNVVIANTKCINCYLFAMSGTAYQLQKRGNCNSG